MIMIKKYTNLVGKVGTDGYFEGYANVFGIVDDQSDMVIKGAFAGCVEKCVKTKKYPNMYFNHDPSVPIGAWIKMEEDEYGLYVVGRLMFVMPMAASVEALMHRMSLGLSVGMRILSSKRENGVRKIYKVDLKEISVTRRPANRKSRCFIAK